MKKLTGMKKSFSSLENKKLSNLSSIIGGGPLKPSTETWTTSTCVEETGNSDSITWQDGVKCTS